MNEHDLYGDIKARTNGEIYIGVVGPVRTGKSTFIKRFMNLAVIPNISDENERTRAIDELPQAATGKTVMTTEPKFIPKEAVYISLKEDVGFKIRMIDCVGYMVDKAAGQLEENTERMVKTPWLDYEIPFSEAAEMGTRKVVNEHSTVAAVITTDGSFGEIKRADYVSAEEKTIGELKKIGKPFIVILNTSIPYSEETIRLAGELEAKYDTAVLPLNCEQLRNDDVKNILQQFISVFPVTNIGFYLPKWLEIMPNDHYIKADVINCVKGMLGKFKKMKDVRNENFAFKSDYIQSFSIDKISMENGGVSVNVKPLDSYYYKVLSEIMNIPVDGEYQFISTIRELAKQRQEYSKVNEACEQVRMKGYGIVAPVKEEIELSEPELIKQGSKFGIKIRATAPSVHMIQANIETEIAPIVGSEEQAQDLIKYMNDRLQNDIEGIWETNIFGKTMKQLIDDGIMTKINKMTEESRQKLQDTMQKIVNESNGGLICIII